MTIKRAVLALLTIFAIAQIGLSLKSSLAQPQIQSRLELYQTNLMLHVAEFKANPTDDFDLNSEVSSLVGEDPYSAASKKYQQVRQESIISRDNFASKLQQLDDSQSETSEVAANSAVNIAQKKQLNQQITKLEQFINELDLKRGILTAVQGKPEEAIEIWEQQINRLDNPESNYAQTAILLKQLWQENPRSAESNVAIITNNLDSWFRYQALAK